MKIYLNLLMLLGGFLFFGCLQDPNINPNDGLLSLRNGDLDINIKKNYYLRHY